MEKLEWLGYPIVKKFRRYLFILAQLTKVTDTQTSHAGIYRAYAYAWRGKNCFPVFTETGQSAAE